MSPKKRRSKASKSKDGLDLLSLVGVSTLALGALGWLLGRYLIEGRAGWGYVALGMESWSLKVHGTGVMLCLVAFGRRLDQIREFVQAQKKLNLALPVALLTLLGALTVTGWLLYYGPTSELQDSIVVLHWGLGLLLALACLYYFLWKIEKNPFKAKV